MSSVARSETIRAAFVAARGSRLQPPPARRVDVERLLDALRRAVCGEVRFDGGSRALYATGASNYRQIPIGVVIPRDVDDVVAAVAECRRFGAPVVSRGGGTSLAGQCCNVAVVLDFSKYLHRVLHVDPAARSAQVQPGCVLDDLRAAAEPHRLTFGPDPATHNHCTLGGMIGVAEVMAHGPTGCEGIDDGLVRDMQAKGMHHGAAQFLPEGKGWLLVEFGGDTRAEADDKTRALMAALRRSPEVPTMKLYDDPADEQLVWEIRESGRGATAFVPGAGATWPGWEDAAIPPEREGEYLRRFRALLDRYGYRADLYGHFGQGCIHTRVDFDLTSAPGIQRYRAFIDDAADLVASFGGSLSGEHGDGQSRAELLHKMFGRELVDAFAEFKAIWDPTDGMNPRKVVRPYRATDNLRLGTGYNPPEPRTHFHYGEDGGSFAHATVRCVGVGKCRRAAGGTMCPSYMVTREEQHSTRGRASLLFEMLQGQAIDGGWRDEHVKQALDLCLACKGCKDDCPVNVDMATYKAEFLSHYYAGRLRPMTAYTMGLIHRWARLAAPIPHVANAVAHAPLIGEFFKRLAGVAPQRDIPRFAPQSFQHWFRGRARRNAGRPQVMLWPDTFNNYFLPRTARAAVEVPACRPLAC